MLGKNSICSSTALTQFKYFFIISILFSGTWLVSDVAAVKLVHVFGFTLTGGFIIFPFTSMLSYVIVEVYGYKNARQAVWSGLILNLLFVLLVNLVNIIPPSPYWKLQNEFNDILIPGTRIIIASIISFVVSDFINNYIMAKMKIKSNGKSIIKRILFASVASLTIDIGCFMALAFAGTMPTSVFIKLLTAAYCKKVLCQIIFLPLTLYLISLIKKYEGIEVYDHETNFNPFSTDNIYELAAYRKIG